MDGDPNVLLAEAAHADDEPTFHANGQKPIHTSRGPLVISNSEILDRAPPHDAAAERALNAAAILKSESLAELAGKVHPSDFYIEANRNIYQALQRLAAQGVKPDTGLLVAQLKKDKTFEQCGGIRAVAELFDGQSFASNAAYYADIIRGHSLKRKAIAQATSILQKSYSGAEPAELAESFRNAAEQLTDTAAAPVFNRITAAQLASTEYSIDYHIPGFLAVGQPCGIIGPKKVLKTTIALDMALALASGGYMLGRFKVDRPGKVLFDTGENGMASVQESGLRICQAANIDLADQNIIFSDTLPQFADPQNLAAFERFLKADDIEIVFIDPVYLAMNTGGNEGSLFAMGALLRNISELCQRLNVTLILLHHMKKGVLNPFDPGELDDASWSGFAEFFRQWILLSRRERYEPGTGEHKLWLSAGGSAGHSSLWALDVAEGVRTGPGTRKWDVTILTADEARDGVQANVEAAKQAKADVAVKQDAKAILKAIAKYPDGETLSVISTRAKMSHARAKIAIAECLEAGDLIECQVTKNGNKKLLDAYKLSEARQ